MANVIKPKGKKKKRENSRMFSLSLYFPQPEKKINVSPIKIIVEAIFLVQLSLEPLKLLNDNIEL